MLRRVLLGASLAVAATVLAHAPNSDSPAAEAAPISDRVTLFSDSVGLGTRGYFDGAFPASWEANVLGTPALFVGQLESKHVRPTLAGAPHLIGDHVVIAAGYNYPFWDPARFDREVDSMVNTLTAAGVKHVYWVTLREVKPQYISASAWRQVQPYYWYFPEVNDHLEAAVSRHRNLTLVDWAAVADQPGLTYDAIHLNRTGAELYSALVARAVQTNMTRPIDGSITRIDVTDEPDAQAVALNLAATETRVGGYFTAYDCEGDPPQVANINYGRTDTVSGAAIVPVDDDGNICIFNSSASQVIVDVFGVFDSTTEMDQTPPSRVFDSRPTGSKEAAGSTRELTISDPGAGAVALTITGIKPDTIGYITLHDCAVTPTTATVNVTPGRITPNLVLIRPDDTGKVCVTTTGTATHVTVDRFATFANLDAVDTIEPTRLLDSRGRARSNVERFSLADTPVEPATGPDDAITAAFLNLAIVNAAEDGYATAWPCDEPRPTTANANFAGPAPISNFVTVAPDDDGEICIWTSAEANVVVDLLGVARDGFDGFTPRRALDTRG